MMQEEWIAIKGYEKMYMISNHGNVKSLSREILQRGQFPFMSKEKILKFNYDTNGYSYVYLYKDGVSKKKPVHQLVAIHFLNHIPEKYVNVVDHINNVKSDNRVENLQILSHRENIIKQGKGSSKYPGVSFRKKENRWRAQIRIGSTRKHLGNFIDELDAANAYQKALKNLTLKNK